ncbi:MAG: hypothetical protein ABSB87_07075 [Terriglobales bacterium]|jgi:hypothetical protein
MGTTAGKAPIMAMAQSPDGTGTKTHTNTNPAAKIASETSSLFEIALASDCMSIMTRILSGYCRSQGQALLSGLARTGLVNIIRLRKLSSKVACKSFFMIKLALSPGYSGYQFRER